MTQPSSGLLDGEKIVAYLEELSAALPAGNQHAIVLAGGSFLALHHLRTATRDIDSIRKLDPHLREAAAEVGARHDLAPQWLNDDAAAFAPAGLREEMCAPVLDTPTLLVLEPPAKYVFAMKLYSPRVADTSDLRPLWPLTGFTTPEEAIGFMRECYAHAEPQNDPFLADFLRDHVIHG